LNREITLTIIVLVSTTTLIVGLLCIYTNNEIQRIDNEIVKTKINEVQALSSRFALRLQYVTGLMELTSQTFPITEHPIYSNLISDDLKGIPQDADTEKRNIARNMFDEKFELEYVFYTMPNGDMYFLEPFSSQVKLSQLNFAFRDWYSGAVNTGSTYVSEVYVSANEKHNVIAIAVPIYDANQTLNGIFVGALDLGAVQRSLSQITHGKNEYFLIVDHNNDIVVDSRKPKSDIEIKKFTLDLSEHQENKVNIITKTIDGQDHTIAFKPIPVGTHKWLVMSIQPHDDVFVSSNALRNEALGMIMTVVAITSISGFFMIRKINTNIHLTDKLKQNNLELEIKTEQLKQVNSLKDEFAAMVSHELKTPLVPIIGYCKMLLKKDMIGNLNKEQIEAVEVITRNVKRLEKLIIDILDARKLDLNRMRFVNEEFSLSKFLSKIESTYKNIADRKKIQFTIDSTIQGTTITADEGRLRQVFDNLIDNAIKFVPPDNGKITIGARRENQGILFSVSDNGIGIPVEKQPELFHKFYQIDTSMRRNAQGSGLGLAICKGIVEAMGGTIWVESDGKIGSTFYFQLPL
jgi:signal transduction histidine kinase